MCHIRRLSLVSTPFEPFTFAQRDPETELAASIMIPLKPAFLLPPPLQSSGSLRKATRLAKFGPSWSA